MPIPLGILAAAGFRPAGAAGAYELIETVTVGSGGAASVTFSNLNTYSTTYQHLQIRAVGRSTSTNSQISGWLRMNGDTGNNYAFHFLYADGSAVYSNFPAFSTNLIDTGAWVTSTRTSGVFTAAVIDILDPYEAKNKTTRTLLGSTEFNRTFLSSGLWMNTTTLSSISLIPSNANWAQGSRFSIYGLKGA